MARAHKLVLFLATAAWCAPLAAHADPAATRLTARAYHAVTMTPVGPGFLGGGTGPMEATLTDAEGTPLPGKLITFEVGGGTYCTGVTDEDGLAGCGRNNGGYEAVFAGDDGYAASTDEGCLVGVTGAISGGPIEMCVYSKETLFSAKVY